jgi:RHS repeat-associated protein
LTGVLLGKTSEVTCAAPEFEQSNLGLLHAKYRWVRDGMLDTASDLSAARAGTQRLDATYQYDRLHQLTGATTSQAQFGYEYDSIQNLTRRTKQVGTQTPVPETLVYGESAGPNALTHVGATRLDYDAIGQLKQLNGYDLKYDVEGRLIEANKTGGKRLEYFYDAWGDRRIVVLTEPGGRKRVFRYPFSEFQDRDGEAVYSTSAMGVNAELRRSPGLEMDALLLDELTAYVNAPQDKPKPLPAEWMDLDGDGDGFDAQDLAEAQRAFWEGRRAGTARVEWRFAQADYLGSSLLVTDSAGDPVSVRRHEPYGALAQRIGVQPTHGFTGAEVEPDEELGLVRMGTRYYAPGLGRWITPDRFIGESPQAMLARLVESNLYSYAANNPIVAVDPDGQFVWLVAVAIVVGVTATTQYANAPAPGEKTYHKSNLQLGKEMVQNSATAYSALSSPAGFVKSMAREEATEQAKVLADKVDPSGTLSTAIDVGSTVKSVTDGKGSGQLGIKKMASKKPAPKPKAKKPAASEDMVGSVPKAPKGKGSVPPSKRDPKRAFDRKDVQEKLDETGGCQGCEKPIKLSEAKGHHVKRHADGGKTEKDNLAVLCEDCHKEVHK